jgi:hypothetical protein
VLVITRPGHWNLVLGQVSLPAALATIAALWLAPTRPWLAGLGFAVATFKPTYGLPLLALLAIRREWRALTIGVVLAGVLTMIPLGIIIARAGVDGFIQAVLHQYGTRVATPIQSPVYSTFRVDVVGLVARHLGHAPAMLPTLLLSGSVLAVAAAGLWRLPPDDEPARRLGLTIASLALILCAYHQQYDLPLLAPMLVATWPLRPFRPSAWPLVCIAVPFLDYIASGGFQRATGITDAQLIWVSSVNIVALLAAFALVVRQASSIPVAREAGAPPARAHRRRDARPPRSARSPLRDRLADPVTRLVVTVFVDAWATRGTWSEGQRAPTPKMEAASAVIDGKLYVIGGFAGTTYGAPVEPMVSVYDPVSDRWTRAADLPLEVSMRTPCSSTAPCGSPAGIAGRIPDPRSRTY